ncbi:hypothetical protein MSNKSG1_15556 [Marinobacter santoriniensis NKSG1]|uniref:Uncharacterized protein n=2 Tax=Marinobacter santoriniensis TaxID=523742 RepID=M7D9Q0_9GAMM|nr:hypothetical protein MSNKSG1_15556 [Marinobacter santoriniensis NKSG1]
MPREVVLARPHPFIRKPMTELLTKIGFAPVAGKSSGRPAGVIVSSSVTSEAGSFEDVLKLVKNTWDDVPLVVATLLKPDMAIKSLGKDLAEVFPGKRVGFPSESRAPDILLVGLDDLRSPQTERVFQAFFR